MSISYREATEFLSELQDTQSQDITSSEPTCSSTKPVKKINENGLNISAISLDSCDAHELMHCYQLAIDFGVPTARRALALYKSRSVFNKDI